MALRVKSVLSSLSGGPAETEDRRGDWVQEDEARESGIHRSFPTILHSATRTQHQQLLGADVTQGQTLEPEAALDYIINQLLLQKKQISILPPTD